jgi:hypothetical protein
MNQGDTKRGSQIKHELKPEKTQSNILELVNKTRYKSSLYSLSQHGHFRHMLNIYLYQIFSSEIY